LVGENYGRFTKGIYYRGDKFKQKQLLMSFNPQMGDTTQWSIFATSREFDPRPSCARISRTFLRTLPAGINFNKL
jgi:hypothetical protein